MSKDSLSIEDCLPLSQSKYILAKYRIQVEDEKPSEAFEMTMDILEDEEKDKHVHFGPQAIDPNLRGGRFGWNYESLCQFLWCFCVPCYTAHICWIRCCEMCYDNCSRYITEKEEVSLMKLCTRDCCRI